MTVDAALVATYLDRLYEIGRLPGGGVWRPVYSPSWDEARQTIRTWLTDTGLLVRLIRYAETPVGRNPTQIDYSDYREVDGVKTPWRWTLSRPNGRFTIQVKEARNNVPIDDAKFVRPAGDIQ